MTSKPIISTFLFSIAITITACGGDDDEACVGHTCPTGDVAVTDGEGGNIIFEYIYFDTELQAALGAPATVNRVMAYFMSAQTPNVNTLPTPGQCNNLVATKGWPEAVGTQHTDVDVGALTITGKNTAGADVTIAVPKGATATDQIGRPHDTFYQVIKPGAADFLKPDSFYTVNLGGAGDFPATSYKDALFLAANFTVKNPELEGGSFVAGTDVTVEWNPSVSANKPPADKLVGGDILGVTWLVDTTGAPTHMCPTAHSAGKFTIPGAALAEYQQIAKARSLPPNKMILLRNSIAHQVVQLPTADPSTNKRRIDMVTLVCWAQLVDVADAP